MSGSSSRPGCGDGDLSQEIHGNTLPPRGLPVPGSAGKEAGVLLKMRDGASRKRGLAPGPAGTEGREPPPTSLLLH